MANFSFDIVSELDKAALNNVYDQVQREIENRYDFKNTPAALEWLNAERTGIKITAASDWQRDAILDIVRKKLAVRGVSQSILDTTQELVSGSMRVTQEIPFHHGLDQEKAKKISQFIRDSLPKLKAQIQGETVRVSGTSKDDLQAAMQSLREADFGLPLQFQNYR